MTDVVISNFEQCCCACVLAANNYAAILKKYRILFCKQAEILTKTFLKDKDGMFCLGHLKQFAYYNRYEIGFKFIRLCYVNERRHKAFVYLLLTKPNFTQLLANTYRRRAV